MTPLEATIREVCRHLGADPNAWQGFEEIGRAAISALIATMPSHLAEAFRQHLGLEKL